MPALALADADLAALLGFLRSEHPLLVPDSRRNLRSEPTFLGTLAFAGWEVHASSAVAPPPGPNAAYGQYLARAYACVACHTEGWKTTGPHLLAGGVAFVGPDLEALRSSNLTPDGTGLYLWTFADFSRVLTEGVRPDSSHARTPMPRFALPEVEQRALWAYLRHVPRRTSSFEEDRPIRWSQRLPQPVEVPAPLPDFPGATREAAPVVTGDQLFGQLGCKACHATGAACRAQFLNGRTRTVDYLINWIRHPELLKPGTPMPTFANALSEERARILAMWILETPVSKYP